MYPLLPSHDAMKWTIVTHCHFTASMNICDWHNILKIQYPFVLVDISNIVRLR